MSDSSMLYHESGYCEFPADLALISEVSSRLKSFCQRKCLDETLWPQIDLALCECLNNAVEHGCNEDASLTVRVAWRWQGDSLIIEVEDPGRFEESSQPNALPDDPLDESGRGYFIIDSIAESHSRFATAYGQKFTLTIRAHPPSDIIVQMEEMYAMLQNFSNELNQAYSERDTITGFIADSTNCPAIEAIIDKGIARLRGMIDIVQSDVWTLVRDGSMENVYHDGPEPLAIREAVISSDLPCACATVIATETEHFVDDCSLLDPRDPLYRKEGCALVCPILYQKDCLGAIALHAPEQEREALFKQLLPIVKIFAQFLGLAYTSAKTFRQREEQERSQTQLAVASEIQRSLLPSSYPHNKHCRLTGRCEAAMAVGGDYIDAIEIRDVGLFIVIADVMGKGVPAALLATIFRTAIHSRLNLAETPGWLLSKINKQIHEELGHLNMFITAQAAFLSYDKRILKLANAGHCPALLLHSDSGEAESLSAEGIPLGIAPDDLYEERLIPLYPGSRVLFLTDGIYEAENARGEMLGLARLAKAVPEFWNEGIESVPNRAFAYVNRFADGRSAQDDQTLIALEIF